MMNRTILIGNGFDLAHRVADELYGFYYAIQKLGLLEDAYEIKRRFMFCQNFQPGRSKKHETVPLDSEQWHVSINTEFGRNNPIGTLR